MPFDYSFILYRGCHVPRLPVAGKHFFEPDRGCCVAMQQVEIRLPRRRDTHAIIRSPLKTVLVTTTAGLAIQSALARALKCNNLSLNKFPVQ